MGNIYVGMEIAEHINKIEKTIGKINIIQVENIEEKDIDFMISELNKVKILLKEY